jgi:hypothetical protein
MVAPNVSSPGGSSCVGDESVCYRGSPAWHTYPVLHQGVPLPFAGLAGLGAGLVGLILLVVVVGAAFLRQVTEMSELRAE